MRYTRFGQTDLEVSRVCYGTWQGGGDWGSIEESNLEAAIRRALDLGINFFDTAQAYGFGVAEQLLGRALEPEIKNRRDEIILATKGGLRMEGNQILRDSSPEWLRQGVEDSLRFLGTDYIDLYQVHWPDPDTPFEETAGVLDEMVREGKIRYVGVSNFDARQMAEFEKTRKIDGLQPPYHLFRRDIEEEILPYCVEHGIGVLVYGPLAHGLLSGKMVSDQEFSEGDWRAQSDLFRGENFRRNLETVEELKRFAEERGRPVAQLAGAWTRANPAVDAAIVGARRPDQIEGTAPASEFDLSEDDLREIESIMQGAVMVGGPSPERV
ncbi:MAG TPA: aldo/keto reductase [Rubrobacteraceae bacterium]|nr:aldo/keto reductase [Rubrobacteraceae bacterium]